MNYNTNNTENKLSSLEELHKLTILKNSFDIQAVRGARLVIRTPFEVAGEFACAGVVDDARVTLADRVLRADQNDWNVGNVGVEVRHLGVVRVDGVKTHLVLEAEDEYDGIDPMCELQTVQERITV